LLRDGDVTDGDRARVLITGASRGLGRALAAELHSRDYDVVATARHVADLAELETDDKIPLDVTDPKSVEAAVAAAGELEVLVNNAALTVQAPVEAVPLDVFRSVLETNVLGPLRLMQAFLPSMRKRGRGTIVNISSGAVRSAPQLQGTYSASKAALELLSETLRKELQPFGVRVVVISAGGIRTEMRARQEKYASEPYADLVEQFEARMADYEKRGGGSPPEEIAKAITDLIEERDPPPLATLD
jgi:NAD(P)-dependent dehydrogenase (short-subunit alcohol dehydrogenase family)